jgi:hypothetical protein
VCPADALEVGGNLVESAASLVPDSVPRGVAKGGVAVAGVLVAFWVLQKVRALTDSSKRWQALCSQA